MSARNRIPRANTASLEARLAPFTQAAHARDCQPLLEDLDVEASRSVSGRPQVSEADEPHLGFLAELKLLFASLGAGTTVVPMGDNGRRARLLAEYAASLRRD